MTSQCTKITTVCKCIKIRITRCEKSRFSPVLAKIFIKKNVRNHSYHQFCPVLVKIRINRELLYLKQNSATIDLLAFLAGKDPVMTLSSQIKTLSLHNVMFSPLHAML